MTMNTFFRRLAVLAAPAARGSRRSAGLVLAGKDAEATEGFLIGPLIGGVKFAALRLPSGIVTGRSEIGWADRRVTACVDFLGAHSGVGGGEGNALDAVAALGEEGPRRRVVLGLVEHAQQLHIVGPSIMV